MNYTEVMLDLETLGTKPGSVILSIGAVKMQLGRIVSEIYLPIDPQSCVDLGMTMDVSTVMWWLRQSDAAREGICGIGIELSKALLEFSEWLDDPCVAVWGNGSEFDNVLLAHAYAAAKLPVPWDFRNNRCYRTLKALYPGIPMIRIGTKHNALDDARNQAEHLLKILEAMNKRGA